MLSLVCQNSSIPIKIDKSHPIVKKYIMPAFKHLRHIPLQMPSHDFSKTYKKDIIIKIFTLCKKARLPVTEKNLESYDQCYLNYLHKFYEKGFTNNNLLSDQEWMCFHEFIHLLEKMYHLQKNYIIPNKISINYREKAGLVTKKIDIDNYREYLEIPEDKIGLVRVTWAELGKSPLVYWQDKEPDNIERLKELAKPWLYLRPKIEISIRNTEVDRPTEAELFNAWWTKYHDQWCKHYGISKWSYDDQKSCFVIGKLSSDSIGKLIEWQENSTLPERVIVSI